MHIQEKAVIGLGTPQKIPKPLRLIGIVGIICPDFSEPRTYTTLNAEFIDDPIYRTSLEHDFLEQFSMMGSKVSA